MRVRLFMVIAATAAAVASSSSFAQDVASGSLRLRPGDAVRLLVLDEPGLAGEHAVLESGAVLLPLIGLVQVAGIAFDDVARSVRAAYAAELIEPVVVLQPLIRVRVLGEVRQPGLYLIDPTFGLHDVLAHAGGLAPTASTDEVLLVRDGAARTFDPRAGTVLAGGLRPGDEVLVPRRSWLSENLSILVGAGTSVLAAAVTALLVR